MRGSAGRSADIYIDGCRVLVGLESQRSQRVDKHVVDVRPDGVVPHGTVAAIYVTKLTFDGISRFGARW